MGRQVVVECPECGERWTVEQGQNANGWYNADRCPKCGFMMMKI